MSFVIPSIFTAVDKLTQPLKSMQRAFGGLGDSAQAAAAQAERSLNRVAKQAKEVAAKGLLIGAAIAAPLIYAGNEAVKFEDKLADVAKTTGLAGQPLKDYGQNVLTLAQNTRSSIDDILKIGEIGGQLGVATNEIMAFTIASNMFAVALAKDYGGGVEEAISQVGKIKNLFKDTRNLPIDQVINKAGSAINELGAVGAGTSANINDFILRIGALPDVLKPTLTNAAALGTFFEEVGLNSEIASGGLTRFLLDAGKLMPLFAQQMKMSTTAANGLYKTDPTAFASKFAKSLGNLSPDQLAIKLEKLGVGTQESIKVLGALGSETGRLAELQNTSNTAFENATSLQDEYNKKNETTAAQIKKAQNAMQALSIEVGGSLIPALNEVLKSVKPMLTSFTDWARENPQTLATIVKLAAGLAGISLIIGGLGTVFAGVMTVLPVIMSVIAAVFSPLGVIVATLALIGIGIYKIIENFESWGATIAVFMGPLGLVISLLHSFYRNWDMIKEGFQTGGIIGGLKAIGATLLDVILLPLQQILTLVGNLPGKVGEWATKGADSIAELRNSLGTGVNKLNGEGVAVSPNFLNSFATVNPLQAQAQAIEQTINKNTNNKVSIDINDKTGQAAVTRNTGVPLVLTSTMGFGK